MAHERTIAEAAQATRLLTGPLSRLEVDAVATYAELSALVGLDVQTKGRGYLHSARKMVERDHGVLLGCVPNVGIKRLGGDGLAAIGDETTSGIRRKVTRTCKRLLRGMGSMTLTNEQTVATNTRLSMLGAIGAMSTTKAAKRIEAEVVKHNAAELPVGKVLTVLKD